MRDSYDESDMRDIDWKSVDQPAASMEEFEVPILIDTKVTSLKNICQCPRLASNNGNFEFYVLRIELMFGDCAFPDASWDIEISASDINDNIVIPSDRSIFTTQGKINFCELPRECVWCFTLYGIQKNNDWKDTIAEKDKKDNTKSKANTKIKLNKKDIVDYIESYHTSKYYKSGIKNDRFFNEAKDDSVGQATSVCEFTAFQGPFQSQPTSVASHIGSPVNNINNINGNMNTTKHFSYGMAYGNARDEIKHVDIKLRANNV